MSFECFPGETIAFLKGLRENNAKAWFDAHRADYEAHWLLPAKAFVAAAGARLQAFAPSVAAEPRVGGSIFRINRDTRFSKDKTPYKDHLDFWFWEGERKAAVSGFFARMTPDHVGIGAGCHGFDRDRLETFRRAVCGPKAGAGLVAVAGALESLGYAIAGKHYKRPPTGFAAGPAAARFLLHNALYVHVDEPAAMATAPGALVEACARHWRALAPLHEWLITNVQDG